MIDLNQPLAPDSAADEYDVRRIKKALNRLGHYTPYNKVGITGITDNELFDAIRAYQSSRGLRVTGQVKPDDETISALNSDLAAAPEGYYIWRTVGDDKVRGEHTQYNGTVRVWSDAPDPGEDYNCRCWAEAVEPGDPRLYPDAIHPTIGPFDLLSGGAIIGVRAIGRVIANEVIRQQALQHPYDVALRGERHAGFLQKYKNASNKELEKGIKSFNKQINSHIEKIKNPEKEYPNFKNLDKRRQENLLERKWPSDIKRLKEEQAILRRILNERD